MTRIANVLWLGSALLADDLGVRLKRLIDDEGVAAA